MIWNKNVGQCAIDFIIVYIVGMYIELHRFWNDDMNERNAARQYIYTAVKKFMYNI